MPARGDRRPHALAHRNRTAHTKVAGPTPRSRPWCRPDVLCVSPVDTRGGAPIGCQRLSTGASGCPVGAGTGSGTLDCVELVLHRAAALRAAGYNEDDVRRLAASGCPRACPARRLCGAGEGTRRRRRAPRPAPAGSACRARHRCRGQPRVRGGDARPPGMGTGARSGTRDVRPAVRRPARGSAARPHRTPTRGRRRHGPRAGRDVSGPDGRRCRAARAVRGCCHRRGCGFARGGR